MKVSRAIVIGVALSILLLGVGTAFAKRTHAIQPTSSQSIGTSQITPLGVRVRGGSW